MWEWGALNQEELSYSLGARRTGNLRQPPPFVFRGANLSLLATTFPSYFGSHHLLVDPFLCLARLIITF
jgi:hypothetical protein